MQAAVKTRRTEFRLAGDIPSWLVRELKLRYPNGLTFGGEDDGPPVDVRETEWFKTVEVGPGEALRAYRRNRGMTQEDLARLLGARVTKRHVSDMEAGRRGISKGVAKTLARVFGTSPARFL